MIILDTNILSELMNPAESEHVVAWADTMRRTDLFTTAINKAEILFGLAVMPKGRRRDMRLSWAEAVFLEEFRDRILPFEERAAEHYADIVASRQKMGKRIEPIDAQIAAIARSNGMSVATRNVKDFMNCGVEVINPGKE